MRALLVPALCLLLAAAAPPVPPEAMQDVSFEGLDAGRKALAVRILNEEGCDCGCGMKVAVCRRDDAKCARSRELAQRTIEAVRRGESAETIRATVYSPPSKFVSFAIAPGDAPSIGPDGAKVTVLHFVDYQCPFCARAAETIAKIASTYPADVRVVFKMHPLPIHPNAERAAEAALAAAAQGKFLAYHDKLFAAQRDLSRDRLVALAREAGLDVDRFVADLDGHIHLQRVRADAAQAASIGASATPATFVNGRFVSGAKPFELFRAMIDEEIGWAASGTRPAFRAGRNVREASPAAAQGPDPNRIYALPAGDGPSAGPAAAPVTILHYFDYQCPVCARVHPTLERLIAAHPEDVRVVYKMHPLSRIHPMAMRAAEAALAAQAQGKFPAMHRKLMERSRELSDEKIDAIALEIGLDMDRYRAEMASHAHRAAIDSDTREVVEVGATATPTSFVNGRFLLGAQPIETFERVVSEELAKRRAGP